MPSSPYRSGDSIPGTPYRFVRVLGAGGHGSVYAVEHVFLQAPAVMKLLHAELADKPELAERMTLEARMLAKLRHPNIVEVRDGGMTAEDPPRPFFVMESLSGMPLRELLPHAPRGVGVLPALRMMTGVLEGLEHAHRAGIVHRDIKPDNIYLHRTSADITVPKILDFGIAHVLLAEHQTGRCFLGTPRYAAPEQLRGELPTPATDIYAAGLVLYELLTGEAPFARLRDLRAMLDAHLRDELPPVSGRVPDATAGLDTFLAWMLAKDPLARPPSAFAAAVALREIRAGVEARQAGSIHAPEFRTEPTPMDNLLVEASPEDIPFVTVRVPSELRANDTIVDHVSIVHTPSDRPFVDRQARTNTAVGARFARVRQTDTEPIIDGPIDDTTPGGVEPGPRVGAQPSSQAARPWLLWTGCAVSALAVVGATLALRVALHRRAVAHSVPLTITSVTTLAADWPVGPAPATPSSWPVRLEQQPADERANEARAEKVAPATAVSVPVTIVTGPTALPAAGHALADPPAVGSAREAARPASNAPRPAHAPRAFDPGKIPYD